MRWRIRPSPEVADAIARFSIAYESDDARAVRTQKKIPQADWVAKRERFRMLDRGALYATLLEAKSKDIKTRIELLQGEAADPRITDVLNAMIAKPPFISSGTRTVWTQAFKLMVLQGDPRTVTAARAFDASSIATRWDEPSGPIAYLTSRFEKTAERIETAGEPEPASEDDLAFVASLHLPEESPDDIPQILANGLRDPSDPVARLVLADALTEHGHPRGELISLQLAIEESGGTRKEKARQSAIIRDHFDTLLGPMKPILLKGGLVFRGGFVDEAVARDPLPSLEESLKSPLWRTVRVLEAPIELIARPELVSLREAEVADTCDDVAVLRNHPFTSLSLFLNADSKLEAFGDEDSFRNLRRLKVYASRRPHVIDELFKTVVVARLTEFTTSLARLDSALDAFLANCPDGVTVRAFHSRPHVEVTVDVRRGACVRITAKVDPPSHAIRMNLFERTLSQLGETAARFKVDGIRIGTVGRPSVLQRDFLAQALETALPSRYEMA